MTTPDSPESGDALDFTAARRRAEALAAEARADAPTAVHRTLDEAWVARAEEVARLRFVEDYGPDPELWAEHRKILRLAMPSRYQWHTRVSRGSLPALLREAIRVLLDEGVALDGLTVAQVAERAQVDGLDIPDDLADLVMHDPDATRPQKES